MHKRQYRGRCKFEGTPFSRERARTSEIKDLHKRPCAQAGLPAAGGSRGQRHAGRQGPTAAGPLSGRGGTNPRLAPHGLLFLEEQGRQWELHAHRHRKPTRETREPSGAQGPCPSGLVTRKHRFLTRVLSQPSRHPASHWRAVEPDGRHVPEARPRPPSGPSPPPRKV